MGERLGRYAVLKHLASGGMADVLLGRTEGIEGFERHVVLKRILAAHAKDQRFITMFLDEARVAANLHHQNIVQVHDIGEAASGEYFFAMEYIHGEDLRQLHSAVAKTRDRIPLGIVCAILSAAAAGLHYAHERRDNKGKPLDIVHRDVSPSNILIGYDGAVKVADFGIAKAAMRQVETRSGSLKGKVSYMSPEQCKGEVIDRRSDVYALGVLLYELATTTRLFRGENDYLVMDAIVNGKVPLPRLQRPDLPNELSSIIMKALAVDRARRYQTAEDLRTALDQFAIKQGVTASTATLATYMRKLFGERPEPWLDNAATVDAQRSVDVEGPTQAAGQSWNALPRDAIDDTDAAIGEDAKTTTGGKRSRRSNPAIAVGVADTISPPISTRETGTSMKLGWELRGNAGARSKLVWLSVPLVVLAGVGIWQAVREGEPVARAAAAQTAEVQAAPAGTTLPTTPAPAPTIPAVRVAGAEVPTLVEEPAPERVAAVPAKKAGTLRKPAATKADRRAVAVPASPVAAASPRPTAPAPTAAVAAPAPAPPPPGATPTPPPVIAAPPPAPAAEPKLAVTVELPAMPMLSNATVSAVASDYSAQLAKCEGSAQLHGDVAVSFQIDAVGKVVKSQLSSSINNSNVAGCILKAVQSWKFPKPPSGTAKGVYTISYQ